MIFIVYKTTNLLNEKFYIGQHKCKDEIFDGYFGSGLLIQRALEKYGFSNFKRETIEVCNNRKLVNEKEKYWIEKLNPEYNIAPGGMGGYIRKWTIEERKEISERMSNWWKNANEIDRKNHRENVSKGRLGKITSDDGKEIRRKSCEKWWNNNIGEKIKRSYKYSGKGNPNSKYYYRIFQNGKLVEETDNLRKFCEKNNFPLSYVKYCCRNNGKYKDFQFIRRVEK